MKRYKVLLFVNTTYVSNPGYRQEYAVFLNDVWVHSYYTEARDAGCALDLVFGDVPLMSRFVLASCPMSAVSKFMKWRDEGLDEDYLLQL